MDPSKIVVGAKVWVCKKSAIRPFPAAIIFINPSPDGPSGWRHIGYKHLGGQKHLREGVALEDEIFDDELVAYRVALGSANAVIRRNQLAADEALKRIAAIEANRRPA